MNERIEKLMVNASSGACYDGNEPVLSGTEIEKFAELIVKECADVAVKFHLAHPYSVEYQVKKHFGVE